MLEITCFIIMFITAIIMISSDPDTYVFTWMPKTIILAFSVSSLALGTMLILR